MTEISSVHGHVILGIHAGEAQLQQFNNVTHLENLSFLGVRGVICFL